MGDIVTRLRRWTHAVDAAPAGDLMDEAAVEITHWRLEAGVHRQRAAAAVAEIARLRLTDAEREAIQWAADAMRPECRATLRGLLERFGGGR